MPRGLETCIVCARLFSVLLEGRCEGCYLERNPELKKLREKATAKKAETGNRMTCIRCRLDKPQTEFFLGPQKQSRGTCKACIAKRQATKGGRPKGRDPMAEENFCNGCQKMIPTSLFRVDRNGYVESRCMPCHRMRLKTYRGPRMELDETVLRNLSRTP